LSALKPREIAISSPVLVHGVASGQIPATDPDVALPRMFGSTTFATLGRIGVYWETYDVNADDTVDVSLRIAPRSTPGLLRRLAGRLRILASGSNAISTTWREPSPGHFVTTVPGPHAIQARNVNVDLSQLSPGDYTLDVSVARPGGLPVSASRNFTLLPR
jgi:hypothetical protein